MKNINIKARIKRNKLDKLAGDHFRDFDSQIVTYLNNKNKRALLGIQNKDGIYTVVGEEVVYYSTILGIEGEVIHSELLKILKDNAMKLGKESDFEFVKINEKDSIWVFNTFTMNAMWNTIKLLHEA